MVHGHDLQRSKPRPRCQTPAAHSEEATPCEPNPSHCTGLEVVAPPVSPRTLFSGAWARLPSPVVWLRSVIFLTCSHPATRLLGSLPSCTSATRVAAARAAAGRAREAPRRAPVAVVVPVATLRRVVCWHGRAARASAGLVVRFTLMCPCARVSGLPPVSFYRGVEGVDLRPA